MSDHSLGEPIRTVETQSWFHLKNGRQSLPRLQNRYYEKRLRKNMSASKQKKKLMNKSDGNSRNVLTGVIH